MREICRMDIILKSIVAIFLVMGAMDYAFSNRFGLGAEFERGLMTSGRLLLCMTGFMILAPVIARFLTPAVAPIFRVFGADPSILAGLILANDAGGAALAMEMAQSPEAGLYSGQIVGAMMGTTVMLGIPVMMGQIDQENSSSIIYGLLCGICTVPVGCIVGGLITGYDLYMLFCNTIPVFFIAVILLVGLVWFRKILIPIFMVFGKCLTVFGCLGLALGGMEYLLHVKLLPESASMEEVFSIIGGITLFLGGIFPFAELLRRLCRGPLGKVGNKLSINQTAVSGLLLTLANCMPTFGLLKEMDEKGRMLNTAFIVSASCTFGDHLAYVTQTAPDLTAAVLLGKLAGGVSAIMISNLLYERLCTHVG